MRYVLLPNPVIVKCSDKGTQTETNYSQKTDVMDKIILIAHIGVKQTNQRHVKHFENWNWHWTAKTSSLLFSKRLGKFLVFIFQIRHDLVNSPVPVTSLTVNPGV